MSFRFPFWLILVVMTFTPTARAEQKGELEIEGIVVTPHVMAPRMKYHKPTATDMGARVDLVLRSDSKRLITVQKVSLDGKSPEELRQNGSIAWHSFKEWKDHPTIPAGARRHVGLNGRRSDWGVGSTHTLRLETDQGIVEREFKIESPTAWISAITYLGSEESVYPARAVAHVAHTGSEPIRITGVKLYVPSQPKAFMNFDRLMELKNVETTPGDGSIAGGDRGIITFQAKDLPLSYGLLGVDVQTKEGKSRTLWGRTRIKRESFDISGGWIVSGTPVGLSVTYEPYLKTLRRLHVNTGHFQDTPGYTDQSGPDGLYTRYPLKYFNNLKPLEQYDRDELLPRLHAAEWLGEPQYPNPEDNESPQRVYDESVPYMASRLPTTVTLSDESTWRYYAGLTDFPHYDAYRVVAPHVDAWNKYDRWGGKTVFWGSPLETIGDMTRSLRELSRPAPTAYWAQGPADGWKGFDGRRRRSPTPDELRSQAYQALGQRITSLYWFNLSAKSLIRFRDTLDEMSRVGREIRMLENFYLEGDATDFHIQSTTGKEGNGWDLSTISSARGALLVANDLEYQVDAKERVFAFPKPRPVTFDFVLPSYLRPVREVWRVDADGTSEVSFEATAKGVRVSDVRSNVGLYVVASDATLRKEIDRRRDELVGEEESLGFDPANQDKDFELLSRMMEKK